MRIRIITAIVIFFAFTLNAKGQNFSEYEVKLAYIYSMVKHFNWPDSKEKANAQFTIGFYGDYDLGNLPSKMYANRKFNGKSCKILDVKHPTQGKECDVVFLIGVNKFEVQQFLKALGNEPVVTVGDQLPDFCLSGGTVNFAEKTSKFRIELCPENLIPLNIQVSNQLVSISKIIKLTDEF